MIFLIDSGGFPRVKADVGLELVGDFLEMDVQSSVFAVDEYLAATEDVVAGRIPVWEGTGNAFTLSIRMAGVDFYNEFTSEELQGLSVLDFSEYLTAWKQLVIANGV